MDKQKLFTLRLIWGAMIFGVLIAFSVFTFVVPQSDTPDLPFPAYYAIMGISMALAAAFYVVREKKNTLVLDTPLLPEQAQQLLNLTVVGLALAEAIGILSGLSLVLGAPFTVALGLVGISLILLAMEFPKEP